VLVGVGLTSFGVYALVAAAQDSDYLYTGGGARYLSPFYSPDLRSMFGLELPFSFAFLVLWAPLGLRLTCYYYRRAYYRSFLLAPPACAVPGPRGRGYGGEARFPLVLQNLHRYFFYFAAVVLGFLWYDAGRAFLFRGADGTLHVGVGVGTLVLLVNVLLLSAFSFGCNSLRHLVGGRLDCFGCSRRTRGSHRLWRGVSFFNLTHKQWAWASLASVAFADLYVRLASAGVLHDPRIF
jgi:UDP-N-acetylmuramyl pentapeptide phosphotransferase/UDP-N-acetylglucosamine-1-phosphate transferase